MPTPRTNGYSLSQITIHWLTVALVLFQLVFGEAMEEVVDAAREGEALSSSDALLGNLHYWFGIAILALVALRFLLRVIQAHPPRGQRPCRQGSGGAARAVLPAARSGPDHRLARPLSRRSLADLHKLAKPTFIVLIVIHAGAALTHHFFWKDARSSGC